MNDGQILEPYRTCRLQRKVYTEDSVLAQLLTPITKKWTYKFDMIDNGIITVIESGDLGLSSTCDW